MNDNYMQIFKGGSHRFT